MAESLSVKNMSNKEKAELYQKIIERYKPSLINQQKARFYGLCSWFEILYCAYFPENRVINRHEYAFLKKDLGEYRKINRVRKNSYFWPMGEYAPRLEYLENRLAYYKNLQNERT